MTFFKRKKTKEEEILDLAILHKDFDIALVQLCNKFLSKGLLPEQLDQSLARYSAYVDIQITHLNIGDELDKQRRKDI